MNSILVISNDKKVFNFFLNIINPDRNNRIDFCDYNSYKEKLYLNYEIIILHECINNFKLEFVNIKSKSPESKIIIYTENNNNITPDDINNSSVYDVINTSESAEFIRLRINNYLELLKLKETIDTNNILLENSGIINTKNNLIRWKHFKESFSYLQENKNMQEGVLAIITIDQNSRTKVSLNRLLGVIKKNINIDDLFIQKNTNEFCIILKNISINDSKNIIFNIQKSMGNDISIRCGMTKIGFQNFDELIKNAQDNLISAINNSEICASITDNFDYSENWINDDVENFQNMQYKIFQAIYKKKLENIIEPLFYRYKDEIGLKINGIQILQYANILECVFSIKSKNTQSELTLHYNGFTKIHCKITHKGLETEENSEYIIQLNKFNEKELKKLLKKLKDEFLISERNKQNA